MPPEAVVEQEDFEAFLQDVPLQAYVDCDNDVATCISEASELNDTNNNNDVNESATDDEDVLKMYCTTVINNHVETSQ